MSVLAFAPPVVALHPTRREVLLALRGPDAYFAHDCVPEIVRPGQTPTSDDPMSMTYAAYLLTWQWLEYRAGVLARNGGECALCPREATHCHHRRYVHLGWEADDDCVGLCADCHGRFHEKRR